MIKYLVSLLFFYLLVLFQVSFLAGFFNLVFLVIILWNIIEKSESDLGTFSALFAGFFLDIFSNNFIGLNVLILVSSSLLIKYFIRKNVQIPFIEKN